MQEEQKSLTKYKNLLITFSVCLIIGLVIIFIGINLSIAVATIMSIIGFAIIVLSLYFIYRLYFYYAESKQLIKVLDAITVKNKKSIDEISSLTLIDKSKTRELVQKGFKKGYLSLYLRVGDAVILKSEYKEKPSNYKELPRLCVKCQGCGSIIEGVQGDVVKCDHCGNPITIE